MLLGKIDDRSMCAAHGVSNIDIATMIAPSGEMMAASLIAWAMREGRKYLRESRNPLADILGAMSK